MKGQTYQYLCACACVCVWEGERESERQIERIKDVTFNLDLYVEGFLAVCISTKRQKHYYAFTLQALKTVHTLLLQQHCLLDYTNQTKKIDFRNKLKH